MKIAAQLISEEVAIGNIFNGKAPSFLKGMDLICLLLSAGRIIIEKDYYVPK